VSGCRRPARATVGSRRREVDRLARGRSITFRPLVQPSLRRERLMATAIGNVHGDRCGCARHVVGDGGGMSGFDESGRRPTRSAGPAWGNTRRHARQRASRGRGTADLSLYACEVSCRVGAGRSPCRLAASPRGHGMRHDRERWVPRLLPGYSGDARGRAGLGVDPRTTSMIEGDPHCNEKVRAGQVSTPALRVTAPAVLPFGDALNEK
jgi:hypothetical protein